MRNIGSNGDGGRRHCHRAHCVPPATTRHVGSVCGLRAAICAGRITKRYPLFVSNRDRRSRHFLLPILIHLYATHLITRVTHAPHISILPTFTVRLA